MKEKVLYHKKGRRWEFTITKNSKRETIKSFLGLIALVAVIVYFKMR